MRYHNIMYHVRHTIPRNLPCEGYLKFIFRHFVLSLERSGRRIHRLQIKYQAETESRLPTIVRCTTLPFIIFQCNHNMNTKPSKGGLSGWPIDESQHVHKRRGKMPFGQQRQHTDNSNFADVRSNDVSVWSHSQCCL